MAKLQVKGFEVIDVTPVVPERFKHLLPGRSLKKEKIIFELHNANPGLASAVRSVLFNLPTLGLDIDTTIRQNITTNPYVKIEYVKLVLNCIQISQEIDPSATFSLHVVNGTTKKMLVRAKSLVQDSKSKKIKGPIFDENIVICTLLPGTYIKIDKIFIRSGLGSDSGTYSMVFAAVSKPLNIQMYNNFEKDEAKKGVSTSVARPNAFRISFRTNGTNTASKILDLVCKELLRRTENIQKYFGNIKTQNDVSVLSIIGEDNTIGNLLYEYICETTPDIPHCNIETDLILQKLEAIIKSGDPINVLTTAINKIITDVNTLNKLFRAVIEQKK